MKILTRSSISQDYFYHRAHCEIYRAYIMKYIAPKGAIVIQEGDCFGWVRHYFWGLFSVARFEKTDISITSSLLKKYGWKRGIVFWSGFRMTVPHSGKWWIKRGYIFSRNYHHSTRSAFSELTSKDYFQKWKPSMRRHRRNILQQKQQGIIYIETYSKLEDFIDVYKTIKLPHRYKNYLISKMQFLGKDTKNTRMFLALIDGIPLAGGFFLDDFPTSTYFVAFQDQSAKKYHLGLALIDAWFEDSFQKGFCYLDFDHMGDSFDPLSYKGYTTFKSEIADYELRFPDVWINFFF